ncbi:MAG: cyclic nucleotide-binding domain-containing protein [Candidatus Magnetomorum sp.]|nr:cyclic nucleotide-binding domain-containing protein [Candidatus Magnetomorum sp.]
MPAIEKIKIISGVYWIGIPEANLYVLCACPADSVKHMMRTGLIKTIERDGVCFESGPNAILLSDVLVQNGHFSNLAEFPVLQMLYRQGMLLPNHPNNTGIKPILIGLEEQILAHMDYIHRGNYGLASEQELMDAGATQQEARDMMRLKLRFAFNTIRPTKALLDTLSVENDPVEIRNDVFVHRTGFNTYKFMYKGESVTVDMNLTPSEQYIAPFELGFHQIKREYFAVIHSGQGDGWDINRPSMASILMFQGSLYLIDAGPNLLHTLTALGISINEIEGVFHTHAHDDHFAGLTTLIRGDHRIKYYATRLVRASVAKKLGSLMSWDSDRLDQYFDVHELESNKWNNVEGLEVRPIFSPHPVETSIFTFRAIWDGGYRTYAHFADLTSFDVLRGMVTSNPKVNGISHSFFGSVYKEYLKPANLKKIDVGGGLIHGKAEDFKNDQSEKIILSHTAMNFSNKEKEIGSRAPFGMVDVLISTNQDHTMRYAFRYLHAYFPSAPIAELRILLNCQVISFNAGTILVKQGVPNPNIYLILTGTIEMIRSEKDVQQILYAGSLIGELSGYKEKPSSETYSACSYVWALEIPVNLYAEFVRRNQLYDDISAMQKSIDFLQDTWLFGDMVTYPVQNKIAQNITLRSFVSGEIIPDKGDQILILLVEGELIIRSGATLIETLSPGNFCREETILKEGVLTFSVYASKPSKVYFIPGKILLDIPVVMWKLLETQEKRLQYRSGTK